MPRTTKNPPVREDEEAERDGTSARVDEREPDDERVVKFDDEDDLFDEASESDDDDDDNVDLDDLEAMEGPDA